MKKSIFATLALIGLCFAGSPKLAAQDTPPQSAKADSVADALTDQQLALLRKDIRFRQEAADCSELGTHG